jgi:hypothetical protein
LGAAAGAASRNRAPPGIERFTVATQLDAHAIGEFDPLGEAVARHRDHDGNIGTQRALDQIGQTFALALLTAEPVDDEDVGALRQNRTLRNPLSPAHGPAQLVAGAGHIGLVAQRCLPPKSGAYSCSHYAMLFLVANIRTDAPPWQIIEG